MKDVHHEGASDEAPIYASLEEAQAALDNGEVVRIRVQSYAFDPAVLQRALDLQAHERLEAFRRQEAASKQQNVEGGRAGMRAFQNEHLFLSCPLNILRQLERELTDLYEEKGKGTVVSYGGTMKQHTGYIAIQWKGLIPMEVRDKLVRDTDVLDFVIYPTL